MDEIDIYEYVSSGHQFYDKSHYKKRNLIHFCDNSFVPRAFTSMSKLHELTSWLHEPTRL